MIEISLVDRQIPLLGDELLYVRTETRPLVDIDLCLNGRWRTVTASITDRSEMTYPALLARNVPEAHTLDIS
ncbi:putative ATP-dependent zinc protease [Natrinema salaciae]|uniref:Putative ATP-dependant zinc protease n=1 Tax=Natrinema salaciae TaxID=1186196 RepID=A0A1H9P1N9_9EURY|nr:RimK/LysX family protein [Natrinema salaciae]SER42214.1 Putative ATP-dependant zinc protease [Natrinema salaciae]